MSRTSIIEQMNAFWLMRLPLFVARRSRVLAGILMDGNYLLALPRISACMPILILLCGMLIGSLHPTFPNEKIFTASFLVLALVVVIGTSSSAWGSWFWLGYVGGDLVFYHHIDCYYLYDHFYMQVFFTRLPLFIPYILLAQPLIFIPLVSRFLRTKTQTLIKQPVILSAGFEVVLQGLLQGALVYIWAQAVPTLIRPVYTWVGMNPTLPVMEPLQKWGWVLAFIAVVSGSMRMVFERRNLKRPDVLKRVSNIQNTIRLNMQREKESKSPRASILFKTLFTTFLLSGVLGTLIDASIFAAVFALILVSRIYIARFGAWVRLVTYIPLILRFIVGLAINFYLTTWIITTMWYNTETFRPITISVVLSMFVFYILMPDLNGRLSKTSAQIQVAHKTKYSP